MAAPLPSGLGNLSAVPQGPQNIDPRMFAPDIMGALAAQQSGLHIGTELANLENVQAQRELESAKIKLAKAQNDLDFLHIENARTVLQRPETQAVLTQTIADKIKNEAAAAALTARVGPLGAAQATAASTYWGSQGVFPSAPGGAAVGPADAAAALSSSTATPSASAAPAATGDLSTASASPARAASASDWNNPHSPAFVPYPARKTESVKRTDASGKKFMLHKVLLDARSNAVLDVGEGVETGELTDQGKKDLEVETGAITRGQERGNEVLKKWSGVVDTSALLGADGKIDPVQAQKFDEYMSEKFPVKGGLVTQPVYDSIISANRAYRIISEIPGQIDKLGDPSFTQRFLTGMPDPEKARSLFDKVKGAALTSQVDENTASRAALLAVLNTEYQSVLNTTTEGRSLRNFTPVDADQANTAIKKVVSIITPIVKSAYEDKYKGVPDAVRKSVEGADSVRAKAQETAAPAAAPVTAVPQLGSTRIANGWNYQLVMKNGKPTWTAVSIAK